MHYRVYWSWTGLESFGPAPREICLTLVRQGQPQDLLRLSSIATSHFFDYHCYYY